ncbi:CinA family protein [Sphingomicrobium sp. XHP0239]|uniref:CinA family protein n=1 Tax=Sphingomicrobium maritimum TaxID=3133972 RepID=UPI0031CC7EFF
MSNLPSDLLERARGVLDTCRDAGERLAFAESCTGGLVSAAMTALPGSSDVFVAGYVTYSNEAKMRMLGVDPVLFETAGAVSEDVAIAMAEGALVRSGADRAVAITGVAGPSGGSVDKPVGTVWFAIATDGGANARLEQFSPTADRATIQRQAALAALALSLP